MIQNAVQVTKILRATDYADRHADAAHRAALEGTTPRT
jgi:hypothetical protein